MTNSGGGPDDVIIVGPRGGRSGPKTIVKEGHGFGFSSSFLGNQDRLGPKAEDLIEENKHKTRKAQQDLGVERQQFKEFQRVDAEPEKRNRNLKKLERDLSKTKAQR